MLYTIKHADGTKTVREIKYRPNKAYNRAMASYNSYMSATAMPAMNKAKRSW